MNAKIKASRMTASAGDPFVGVHALTEFIYCPRAGVLAFEQQIEDAEEAPANLWSLPRWSLRRIEERLSALMHRLLLLLAIVGTLVAFVIVGHDDLPPAITVACVVVVFVIAKRMIRCGRAVRVLCERRRQATRAKAWEPDVDHLEPQRVNWWSLLQAGFESIAYQDPLRDEQWKLLGRPWRPVLRKGALRIPVFVTRGCHALRRQHFARMAAYCHLLARCEGAESPYGVVIDRDSYHG